MEKKLTTDDFDAWAEVILEYRPREIYKVFEKYNIAEEPTPENIMLGAVKFGDPFIDDINEIGVPPVDGELNADGDGLKSFFNKALGAVAGVATAASIFKGSGSAAKTQQPPPPAEDENFEIFGKKIPKIYVYAGVVLTVLVVGYMYLKKSPKK
jgi:hypothetical protein